MIVKNINQLMSNKENTIRKSQIIQHPSLQFHNFTLTNSQSTWIQAHNWAQSAHNVLYFTMYRTVLYIDAWKVRVHMNTAFCRISITTNAILSNITTPIANIKGSTTNCQMCILMDYFWSTSTYEYIWLVGGL